MATFAVFAGANRLSFSKPGRVGRDGVSRRRRFPLRGAIVLTAPELATLWHLPREPLPRVERVLAPKLAAPVTPFQEGRVIGSSSWGDVASEVRLSIPDSRHDLHLLAATGTGKTTVLLNLATQDIAADRGLAVLDPKGDLVRALLERIPAERADDVIIIAPGDARRTVGLNPLELLPSDDPDLVVENTLTIFKRIYERSWGMRTDDILKAALITLVRRQGMTLAHIPLLLTDAAFRVRSFEVVGGTPGLDRFWTGFCL